MRTGGLRPRAARQGRVRPPRRAAPRQGAGRLGAPRAAQPRAAALCSTRCGAPRPGPGGTGSPAGVRGASGASSKRRSHARGFSCLPPALLLDNVRSCPAPLPPRAAAGGHTCQAGCTEPACEPDMLTCAGGHAQLGAHIGTPHDHGFLPVQVGREHNLLVPVCVPHKHGLLRAPARPPGRSPLGAPALVPRAGPPQAARAETHRQ